MCLLSWENRQTAGGRWSGLSRLPLLLCLPLLNGGPADYLSLSLTTAQFSHTHLLVRTATHLVSACSLQWLRQFCGGCCFEVDHDCQRCQSVLPGVRGGEEYCCTAVFGWLLRKEEKEVKVAPDVVHTLVIETASCFVRTLLLLLLRVKEIEHGANKKM